MYSPNPEFSRCISIRLMTLYVADKYCISFNEAFIKFMQSKLYKDISVMLSPFVAAFPIGALQEMYEAELKNDVEEYNAWLYNY